MPIALFSLRGQPDNLAPRSAEFALKWLHPLDGSVEMLFEEALKNIHERCAHGRGFTPRYH